MRAAALIAALLLVSSPALAQDAKEQRTIKNDNVGTVTLGVPRDWAASESRRADTGATVYRLAPPQKTFGAEIVFNNAGRMRLDALADANLEAFVEGGMAEVAPQSVEGKATVLRFGARRDGAYARLTDRAPKPGEFRYLTRGVRLLGRDVVLFTLLSNDDDGAVLRDLLAVVESVAVAK